PMLLVKPAVIVGIPGRKALRNHRIASLPVKVEIRVIQISRAVPAIAPVMLADRDAGAAVAYGDQAGLLHQHHIACVEGPERSLNPNFDALWIVPAMIVPGERLAADEEGRHTNAVLVVDQRLQGGPERFRSNHQQARHRYLIKWTCGA